MRPAKLEHWRKNLYVIWTAQFIAMMGMSAVVPFLPFFIRDLGVSSQQEVAQWSGYVFSAPFLLAFVMTPIWGFLGDRYGRKLMVVRAVLGLGISQMLIGFSQSVEMLFFFRMLQGAISGFIAAALALVSANTPAERTGYALGMLQGSTASGNVLGPLIGGPLADTVGYRPIFFMVAALCFVAGFLVMRFVKETPRDPLLRENKHTLMSNYRYALTSPAIRIALVIIFLTQVSVLMIQPIFALYIEFLEPNKAFLATIAGAIFSTAGIFMVISAPWWGKRNDVKSYKKNLIIAISGAAVSYFLQGLVTQAYQLVFLRAVQGFCLGGILPTLYSYVSKNSELSRRGGIMGIASSFNVLANLVGPAAGGTVGAYVGLRENFLITGALLGVSVLFVRRFFVDLRGGPPPAAEEQQIVVAESS
jgi:DHA1 family multidrug resistance protein-like MFS transporter